MLYCDAYSQWRKATRALRRIGPANEIYRQVAITAEKARSEMRMLAGEFGMTPGSRSRMAVEKPRELDPVQEWLNRA
jgi:P27 family predicted phage terminase small subunit